MKSIELSILPFSSCDRAEMSLQLDGAREWYEDVRLEILMELWNLVGGCD